MFFVLVVGAVEWRMKLVATWSGIVYFNKKPKSEIFLFRKWPNDPYTTVA